MADGSEAFGVERISPFFIAINLPIISHPLMMVVFFCFTPQARVNYT
jgi:hypothetical protein